MKPIRIKQVSAVVLSSMLLSCSLIDGLDNIAINKCEAIVRKVVVRKPVVRKPSNTTNPQQSNQSSNNGSDNVTANRPTVVINNDSKFDTKSDKGNTNSGLQVEKNNNNANLVLGSNNGNKEQLDFIRGDVNGDGQVTVTDLSILKRYLAGNPSGASKFIEKNADLNGDGNITMTDLSQLQQLIMDGGNNNQNSNNDNRRQATMSPVMINEGLYSLQPACAPRMELTVEGASKEAGANVFLYSINSPNQTAPSHQKWRITHLRDYWYKIEAENSNYALNIHNGYSVNGTNVSIWPYGGRMHEFMFYNAGNGYYYIQGNVPGAFMLDVSNGGNANGTNVQIYEYNASLAQRWKLVRVNVANDVHTESIAQRYVDVYYDSALTNKKSKSWIDKGEEYTVLQDNGNSLYVQYYSSGGQKRTGYVSSQIRSVDVIDNNISVGIESKAMRNTDVYDSSSLSINSKRKNAWISKGERFIVLQDCGESLYIQYYNSQHVERKGYVHKKITSKVPDGLVWPVDGGGRDSYNWIKYNNNYTNHHHGTDIAANAGTKIFSSCNGIIKAIGEDKYGLGNRVSVMCNIYGFDVWINYGHMSKFASGLNEGDTVVAGQLIGYVGSTGKSSGNHLHYEVRKGNMYGADCDPHDYLP